MTGSELMEWIRANHAEGLPVVCEQWDECRPGFGITSVEIVKARDFDQFYVKTDDPLYGGGTNGVDVIWLGVRGQ